MTAERTAAEVLERLYAQARWLWGDADADRQRQALRQAAEEITLVARQPLPPDLEPRFFTW
jgi:hypothetical protein